jgi:trehalose/maltose hydrolase-like predicted phosphorylase
LRRTAPDVFAETVERLDLEDHEPSRWVHVADRLALLFDAGTRVYEQCKDFYRLEPVPPRLSRDRKEWFETVFPYQALNQPDVVMAMVLFRDDFELDVQRANWDFYKDKSMNFSSMSFVLNAIMAADMGEMERAHEEFLVAAGMDVDEGLTGRKDTFAGLHGTSAGGAWMAGVFGFGGICLSAQGLRIRPNLPPAWNGLRFPLLYQGLRLHVDVDREQVTVRATGETARQTSVTVGNEPVTLSGGSTVTVRYRE